MTSAADYNAKQITTGQLTVDHITALVKHWQESTAGLVVDGKAGPKTIASIEEAMRPATAPFLAPPLPKLPGGRVAEVTSEFRPADRPDHDGIDMFYRWMPGDKPDFVGDGGCAGRLSDGSPKWVVPYGTPAVAAAAGRVTEAGDSPTGHNVWIDHGNGWRTCCRHLTDLLVKVGDIVAVGNPLGRVGNNPKDNDANHLHFELSPTDRYAPTDPVPFFL